MTNPNPPDERAGMVERRTVASLSRLEKVWLSRRICPFCEAGMLGSSCYALSGSYTLPVIKGVRDKEEEIDLGPSCDMDERRAVALRHYQPRAGALSEGSE